MRCLLGTIFNLTILQTVLSGEAPIIKIPSKIPNGQKPNTKDTCTKLKCEKQQGQVKFGYFSGFTIEGRFLNDSKQKPVHKNSEKECVKDCVKEKQCRTISVVQEDLKGFTCYLSSSIVYQDNTIVQENSKIISLGTAECLKSPCKNGGICKPNYDKVGYTCACHDKWSGKHCTDINPDFLPNVTFTFDRDVHPIFNNEERGKEYGITVPEGVRVISVPDAKTPVLMMQQGKEQGITYEVEYMPFLLNPIVDPRGLVFGFWFKADFVKEKPRVNLFEVVSYFDISVAYDGVKLAFSTSKEFKSVNCNVNLHKTWNHAVARFAKGFVNLFLNGERCGGIKADGFSNAGGYGNRIILLNKNEYNTIFIDMIKIYDNPQFSLEILKEWYEEDKNNYLIH